MANLIERVVGDFGDKRRWRACKHLPERHRPARRVDWRSEQEHFGKAIWMRLPGRVQNRRLMIAMCKA